MNASSQDKPTIRIIEDGIRWEKRAGIYFSGGNQRFMIEHNAKYGWWELYEWQPGTYPQWPDANWYRIAEAKSSAGVMHVAEIIASRDPC